MSAEYANPSYDMLLTSVGPTTEPLQERLLELGKSAANLSRLSVLLAADAWTPYQTTERLPAVGRVTRKVEAMGTEAWTRQYIRYVLGNAAVHAEVLSHLDEREGMAAIEASDMIIVPGGNTYQTMSGLRPHAAAVRRHAELGKPYVGNSAGSIVTGVSIRPASVEPADAVPRGFDLSDDTALGLLDIDIAPHATGRKHTFKVPGLVSRVTDAISTTLETPSAVMEAFVLQREHDDVYVETLTDAEGLSVKGGLIKKI